MPPRGFRNLALVVAALALSACAGSTVTSPTASAARNMNSRPSFAVAGGQEKVQVCHRTGNGTFHLITVGAPAVPAHLAHGDGFPGQAVPGRTDGASFAADCSIVVNPAPQ